MPTLRTVIAAILLLAFTVNLALVLLTTVRSKFDRVGGLVPGNEAPMTLVALAAGGAIGWFGGDHWWGILAGAAGALGGLFVLGVLTVGGIRVLGTAGGLLVAIPFYLYGLAVLLAATGYFPSAIVPLHAMRDSPLLSGVMLMGMAYGQLAALKKNAATR